MDQSTSDFERFNEVESIKDQLKTYKLINIDLSKKVQEYKIELNLAQQENAQYKKELIEQKVLVIKYKRYFNLINENCLNFVSKYLENMHQVNESNLETFQNLSTTNLLKDIVTNHASTAKDMPKTLIRAKLHHFESDDDLSGNNLCTIVEESPLPITSTPLVPNVAINNLSSITIDRDETYMANSGYVSPKSLNTPKISTATTLQSPATDSVNENKENDAKAESVLLKSFNIRDLPSRASRTLTNLRNKNNEANENAESNNDDIIVEKPAKLKRKVKKLVDIPINTKKPRRLARPDPSLLVEPSCKNKMRRSAKEKSK